MLAAREIPGNKPNCLRILEAVAAPEFSHEGVESLLKNDPSMVSKLLRYLNSPIPGLRGEVRSVRDAMSLLGENEFRRWVSIVAIVTMAADKPELIRTALTGAFFCEEISRPLGMTQESSDFVPDGFAFCYRRSHP
jgi:c-di-GMP-related signal transduction protein